LNFDCYLRAGVNSRAAVTLPLTARSHTHTHTHTHEEMENRCVFSPAIWRVCLWFSCWSLM